MDRPAAVPLRAVLLHAAPRPRGPAAGDVRRVAAQRRPRRAGRRHPLRPPRRRRAPGAVRDLRRLRRHDPRRVPLPRPRAGGHRHRRAGRRPRRPQGPGPSGPRRAGSGVVRRPHLLRRAVPRGRAVAAVAGWLLGRRLPSADRAAPGGGRRRPAAADQRRRAPHRTPLGSPRRADARDRPGRVVRARRGRPRCCSVARASSSTRASSSPVPHWSPSAGRTPSWPTSPSRRSRSTAGWRPARWSAAWPSPRPRRARSSWSCSSSRSSAPTARPATSTRGWPRSWRRC